MRVLKASEIPRSMLFMGIVADVMTNTTGLGLRDADRVRAEGQG